MEENFQFSAQLGFPRRCPVRSFTDHFIIVLLELMSVEYFSWGIVSLYIFSSVFLCGCDPTIRVFWHQKTWVQVLHPSLPSLVHLTPLLMKTST